MDFSRKNFFTFLNLMSWNIPLEWFQQVLNNSINLSHLIFFLDLIARLSLLFKYQFRSKLFGESALDLTVDSITHGDWKLKLKQKNDDIYYELQYRIKFLVAFPIANVWINPCSTLNNTTHLCPVMPIAWVFNSPTSFFARSYNSSHSPRFGCFWSIEQ